MAIRHPFTCLVPDNPAAAAAGKILPSHFNADHVIDDGTLTIAKTTGLQEALDGLVPYEDANQNVDLGEYSVKTTRIGINTDIPSVEQIALKANTAAATTGSNIIANSADSDFSSNTGNWTGTGWTWSTGAWTKSDFAASRTLTLNSAALSEPITAQTIYHVQIYWNVTEFGGASNGRFSLGGANRNFANMNTGFGYATFAVKTTSTAGFSIIMPAAWRGAITGVYIFKVTPANAYRTIIDEYGSVASESRLSDVSSESFSEGLNSLRASTYNSKSFAFGANALANASQTSFDAAIGSGALQNSSGGGSDVAIGGLSLSSITTGGANIAIGGSAAANIWEGSFNVFIGSFAGSNGTGFLSGSNNLFIGTQTCVNDTSGDEHFMIGNNCDLAIRHNSNGQINIKNAIWGTGHSGYSGTTISSGRLGFFSRIPATDIHLNKNTIVSSSTTLGSNLVTNGTFTGSATGWTLGTGWVYSGNNVRKTSDGTGNLSQTVATVAGSLYQIQFTVSTWTAGSFTVSLGGTTHPATIGGNGTIIVHIVATSSSTLTFTPTNTSRFWIDNVTVQEVQSGTLGVIDSIGIGTAGTPTARLELPASSTAKASMRINSGVAPASPNNGDIWFDGTDLKMRVGGVTKTFTLV